MSIKHVERDEDERGAKSRWTCHSTNPTTTHFPNSIFISHPSLLSIQCHSIIPQSDFLNHYFDSLRYLSDRKVRSSAFNQSMASRNLLPSSQPQEEVEGEPSSSNDEIYRKELKSYLGRERALLRKRRTKLKLNQFHIITQVGQGGYGEVFLARKKETGQVCALKKLRKKVLVKMDEVSFQELHGKRVVERSGVFFGIEKDGTWDGDQYRRN